MKRTGAQNIAYYVVPAILSSCCFFFLTVVDGIFVGRGVNTDALGAVNLVLPFIMVVGAFYMLITVGGVTITAIRLGRGDVAGVNQTFMNSFLFMAVISTLLCLGGVFFTPELTRLLGAGDFYFDYVHDYLFWYAAFLLPVGITILFQGFCRNDGSPRLVTLSAIVCTAANIFLDWLFIFPLGKGVAGAAIATGISQILALLVVLTHFMRRRGVLRIRVFRIDFALWRKIALRGLPEMVAQFAIPVTTLCMNYTLLAALGSGALNAFSIINYVASFSIMLFFGTSEGFQPLFGQSYGAKNERDLKYYFRAGLMLNLGAGIAIFVLILFTGAAISRLFGADAATLKITISAMPQFTWIFPLTGLNTIISSYLYSTKRTKEAVIINVCRGLLFNSVIIFTVPALFGAAPLWFAPGIAEALALAVVFVLLKYSEKNGIRFS
jgi:putative MATE family efflux protein